MNYYKLLFSFIFLFLHIQASFYEQAIIKTPIAELNTSLPILAALPASPETSKCTRSHQALYNESIECIDEKDDFYQVAFKNIIYGYDSETQKPLNTFWTHKNNILLLRDAPANIVESIPMKEYAKQPTIVLTYPWSVFSVGTRFNYLPGYDTEAYAIEKIDYDTNNVTLDFVPRDCAMVETKNVDSYKKELFIKILTDLVDRVSHDCLNHIIPYVWGGSSFLRSQPQDNFCLREGGWHRGDQNTMYTGYDCSELVMRFAQIAGISFPWKTTSIIDRSLAVITNADTLENGDLIWVPGHIMIISSIENNELIEACGYSRGYGCVHKISLSQCFEGIESYNQLLDRYFSKQPIRLRNKEGGAIDKEHICKLLKL